VAEHETYQRVQFSLAVPLSMKAGPAASSTSWTWVDPNTPFHVTMSVVSGRPRFASETLGPQTYGTPIVQSTTAASQELFVNWAGGKWVEIAMAVPLKDSNWRTVIAQSIRVS
jgi:hypothetical protein